MQLIFQKQLLRFLVFNFYELYIFFSIKDIPTACLPLGGLNAHIRRKKTEDLRKEGNIRKISTLRGNIA